MFHVEPTGVPPLRAGVPCRTVGHMENRRVTPFDPALDRAGWWPAVGLLVLLAGWRVLLGWMTKSGVGPTLPAWLPGFTPLAALAVGGGYLLPRRLGVAVPLGALWASDLALTAIYGQGMGFGLTVARYGGLLALALLGAGLRGNRWGHGAMVAGSMAGSAAFYVVTNTAAWLGAVDYPQTSAGWVQALTTGVPGFPPSWVFFRNSLVSDLLVSMLLAAACLPWRRPAHVEGTLTTPAATV